jgi:hypothetical protein
MITPIYLCALGMAQGAQAPLALGPLGPSGPRGPRPLALGPLGPLLGVFGLGVFADAKTQIVTVFRR